jgi:hypothetical protein
MEQGLHVPSVLLGQPSVTIGFTRCKQQDPQSRTLPASHAPAPGLMSITAAC